MSERARAVDYTQETKTERKAEWKNVGEPPILGLVEKGRPERKKQCEDVKINDSDKGLFFVGDGVSTANGWFAASETAAIIQAELGRKLDQEIENIARNETQGAQRHIELIDALVRSRMIAILQAANRHIFTRASLDPRLGQAATTASLARLVEMPGGQQRLFLSNAGDSRMFLLRGGRLHRLTMDDSMLTYAVREGNVTHERAWKIDQTESVNDLDEKERGYFKFRSMITRSVGGQENENFEVSAMNVQPGDRLLIASDGLTDQLKEGEILPWLLAQREDRAAERGLQQAAEKMSLDGTAARSKADDISALVRTIGERGPDRAYLRPKQEFATAASITPEQVAAWRANIPRLERQLRDAKARGEDVAALETELAKHVYWVARKDLEALEENIPPRFAAGDQVQVLREDLSPPGMDRARWVVKDYDARQGRYLVSHPSQQKHRQVERFQLEMWQGREMTRPNDKIAMESPITKQRELYTIVGFDGGNVVMMRERPEGVERRVELKAVVGQALEAQIRHGRLLVKQLEGAQNQLLDKRN